MLEGSGLTKKNTQDTIQFEATDDAISTMGIPLTSFPSLPSERPILLKENLTIDEEKFDSDGFVPPIRTVSIYE